MKQLEKLSPRWQQILQELSYHLNQTMEETHSNNRLPQKEEILRALELTPFEKVKVLILGQDPYHQPGKANGLAFGHHPEWDGGLAKESLSNIIQEIYQDTGLVVHDTTLESLAQQGVLLLNTRLTVESHQPMSHRGKGWEQIVGRILQQLSTDHPHMITLAWGSEVQAFAETFIPSDRMILTASHPSPLSAHRSFKGCAHFTRVNHWLKMFNKEPIVWGEDDSI